MSAPWPEYDSARRGQAEAAAPHASAWVAANAGSGKTKVLIDRVARLLLTRVEPDSILCVTYTKAAASEMQRRLFERLGEWCVMPRSQLAKALAELEDREPDSYSEDEIGLARELFAKALETPGGLRIETIHAFCSRLLRRFPLEAGAPPGFAELEDEAADRLWTETLHGLGARLLEGEDEIVAATHIAAEAGGARALEAIRGLDPLRTRILGYVAGQGGLKPAIEALRRRLGAGRETIAALVKAAMDAQLPRGRLRAVLSRLDPSTATDAKLHAVLESVLGADPPEARLDAYAGLFFTDRGEPRKGNPYTKAAAKADANLTDLFQLAGAPQGEETLRILALIEAIKARRTFDRSAAILRLATEAFGDFGDRKRSRAELDFEDLIQSTIDLLTRRASAAWVLWKLDGGISHVLVDEAQDTSPGQWTILNALTEEFFSGAGVEHEAPRTLFVVGDQKQSIYSFQGADAKQFLDEGRSFRVRASAANLVHATPNLEMSFRSAPEVLRYVDTVFDTTAFDGGDPFSVDPPPEADLLRHTAHRLAARGLVEVWPLQERTETEEPGAWDAPLAIETPASPRVQLARQIAAFIRGEVDAGRRIDSRKGARAVRPGDFLILVKRRTGGLFDALLDALKREGLPVAGADRLMLLDALAVQDLLNLVRFVLCPDDDLVLAEILKGPFGGFDDDHDLYPLAARREPGETLWSRLRASRERRHAPVRAFLDSMLARRHRPPLEFLTHALEGEAGLDQPGWERILSRFGGPAREPVIALIDRAAAIDASGPASLQLFLDAIERQGGELKRELSEPGDEVRVMTVHGAKGLEAPIVILPDTTSPPRGGLDRLGVLLDEEGAPVWLGGKAEDSPAASRLRAAADARALREHRRLLYVGLTRAEDRLIVCGAWHGRGKAGFANDSWYGVCLAAMQKLADAGEAKADAAGVLRLGHPFAAGVPDAQTAAEAASVPRWISRAMRRSEAGVRVLAPSSIGGAEPPVMSPFGADRAQRLARGRSIHKLFEALPGLPKDERRPAALRFLEREGGFTPAQRAEMADAALRVMEDRRFAAVFATGGRAEAPVVGDIGGAIVNGRVDRLVVTPKEIAIIDYKTDRPAPSDVDGVGESYITQLAAYRAILSRLWPDRPVRCLLVWTDGPNLMSIPEDRLDAALAQAFP